MEKQQSSILNGLFLVGGGGEDGRVLERAQERCWVRPTGSNF